MEEKNRSESFDSLKGILIILVVIGHLILGSLSESTTRLVIYYFHMPLFIGITGYFTSTKSLSLSPLDLSKKYWRRMITPYIPAFVIYTAVVAFLQLKTGAWMLSINEGRINDTAAFILYPYYHLWFIPAIVIFVAITKIISYSRLLTAAAVITAFIMTSIYSWNERFSTNTQRSTTSGISDITATFSTS
ncbi:acyltransferase family protein [Pseudomonas sp. GD03696]|uniref:acyltransferase family protein n=1 Tax=Pseudomonas sp. GD03696 TaxID=2975368 RepID=UPI00244C128E|nr:acyltransferase family protein [Pseudomonas sp. GD03696]MDH1933446.1 acyltransferase family protein [Pseudomonas sp. GD03696]